MPSGSTCWRRPARSSRRTRASIRWRAPGAMPGSTPSWSESADGNCPRRLPGTTRQPMRETERIGRDAGLLLLLLLVPACGREFPAADRAQTLLQQGKPADALEVTEAALRDVPGDGRLQDLRVEALLAVRRADEALRVYGERWGRGGAERPELFWRIATTLLGEALRGPDALLRTRAASALI